MRMKTLTKWGIGLSVLLLAIAAVICFQSGSGVAAARQAAFASQKYSYAAYYLVAACWLWLPLRNRTMVFVTDIFLLSGAIWWLMFMNGMVAINRIDPNWWSASKILLAASGLAAAGVFLDCKAHPETGAALGRLSLGGIICQCLLSLICIISAWVLTTSWAFSADLPNVASEFLSQYGIILMGLYFLISAVLLWLPLYNRAFALAAAILGIILVLVFLVAIPLTAGEASSWWIIIASLVAICLVWLYSIFKDRINTAA